MKINLKSTFKVLKIAYKIVNKLDEAGIIEIKELNKIKKIEGVIKEVVIAELVPIKSSKKPFRA